MKKNLFLHRLKRERRHVVFFAVAFVFVLGFGLISGFFGGHLSSFFSRDEFSFSRTPNNFDLQAWIAPPAYMDKRTIPLATSVGIVAKGERVSVPEGSVLHVKLKLEGETPSLLFGDESLSLDEDALGYFVATRRLSKEELAGSAVLKLVQHQKSGSVLDIAEWSLRLVQDRTPEIIFNKVAVSDDFDGVFLDFEAQDDHRIESIALRVQPVFPAPSQKADPIDVPVESKRLSYVHGLAREDLGWLPWVGQVVDLTLVAMDGAGQSALSEPKRLTLPKRSFVHPLSQILIQGRDKLLTENNEKTIHEVINFMAHVAQQPALYKGDPVILMALRSGAARLVFDPSEESVQAVSGLLWRSAVRLEETGLTDGHQSAFLWQDPRDQPKK